MAKFGGCGAGLFFCALLTFKALEKWDTHMIWDRLNPNSLLLQESHLVWVSVWRAAAPEGDTQTPTGKALGGEVFHFFGF